MSKVVRSLGRLKPSDNNHLKRYSLQTVQLPVIPTPVVLGVNWYTAFDDPQEKDGHYWLALPKQKLGKVRGGHAFCLKPPMLTDKKAWYLFYNQGEEGACVLEAVCRAQTLLNRREYDVMLAYAYTQLHDEFPDTPPNEGTSVRAGMDTARTVGLWRVGNKTPSLSEGIQANYWPTNVDQLAACLSPADQGKAILDQGYIDQALNSWGEDYPHYFRVPLELLEQLVFQEEGEATIIIDRR